MNKCIYSIYTATRKQYTIIQFEYKLATVATMSRQLKQVFLCSIWIKKNLLMTKYPQRINKNIGINTNIVHTKKVSTNPTGIKTTLTNT